ncbi:unnamed protein product [Linum tenue]|uniref:Uncharacterized protein n=1 Tax=Linum tenue TaxID=586396 RepID=A0AAV0JXB6_9ROSI|nr:unnamed protein product [Linum tenue]
MSLNCLSLLLIALMMNPSLITQSAASSAAADKVYIVYMGSANPAKESAINSMLKRDGGRAIDPLRTYRHGLSGFSARLSPEEAAAIADHPHVISVFPDESYKLLTSRSWDFLQELTEYNDVVPLAGPIRPGFCTSSPSSGLVIGFIDTGIWPESESFKSEGANSNPPRGWNGTCMAGADFNITACNGKIIGARHYVTGTARDWAGHGTHVASTAAGAAVGKASYYDLATGTARGGSEFARIAVYKACNDRLRCKGSHMLSAFDDAIGDGVHVISVSSAPDEVPSRSPYFLRDPVAIGAFHAVERGITVVAGAGNTGPDPASVFNDAPWIITVGASTIDRVFRADVVLGGGGGVVKGEWLTFPDLDRSPIHPLTDGSTAKEGNASYLAASDCQQDSLKREKTEGKIVICEVKGKDPTINLLTQANEVQGKGGLGMILVDDVTRRVAEYSGDFPVTVVSSREAVKLKSYLNITVDPLATILPTVTVGNYRPAPQVSYFSTRGPSVNLPNIIKVVQPDVIAPGVSILAAWIGDDSESTPKGRKPPSFNIISGTSVSCPHVAGAVAAIKNAQPSFSPFAIKSAIMTTAFVTNNVGSLITTDAGEEATPYDLGAGELNPTGSLNPGLVYEATTTDHLLFLCYYGYDTATVRLISRVARSLNFSCPLDSSPDLVSHLNYPSMAVRLAPNQTRTIGRVLTNVASDGKWSYTATVRFGGGSTEGVSPERLCFTNKGERHLFNVTFMSTGSVDVDRVVFGWITWTNPRFKVRSPFVILGSTA